MFEPQSREQGVNKPILYALIGVAVLFIAATSVAVYFFAQNKDLKETTKQPASAEDEEKRVITKVEKLYNTPDEAPTIAQVEDRTKVQNQAFFKDAKNGDYVLIYQNARLAILYRESTNKIVNTGPISDAAQSNSPETSDQAATNQ